MNINPSAAASVAGTSRAAARGGETDNQAAEATRQQAKSDQPGGKAAGSSELDAGDHTDDRGGDGRQVLDTFERSEEESNNENEMGKEGGSPNPDDSASPDDAGAKVPDDGGHLDLQA